MHLSQLLVGFLATYLVHSTLFVAVAWVWTRRRTLAPAWRETLWKTAIIGGLVTSIIAQAAPWGLLRVRLPGATVMPVETSFRAGAPVSLEADARLATAQAPVVVDEPSTETADPGRFQNWTWSAVIVSGWLVTSSLLLVRLAWRRRRLRDAFRERHAVEDQVLLATLREVRAASGLKQQLRLTSAGAVPCPMALSAHEICVPERFLTDLDRAEQRAALAHEVAHLVRMDGKWLAGAMVLECVFFVQPLLRLARHEVRDAFEHLADAWAARLVGDRESLATCLVQVATWQTSRSADFGDALAMTGKGSRLGDRVRCLLKGAPELEPSAALRSVGALTLMLCVGGLAPVVGGASPIRMDVAVDLVPPPPVNAVATPSALPAEPEPESPSAVEATQVATVRVALQGLTEESAVDPNEPLPTVEPATPQAESEHPKVVPIEMVLAPGRIPGSPVRVELERRPIPLAAAPATRPALVGSGQALDRAAIEEATPTTIRTSDLFRTMVGVQALCDVVRCRIDGRRRFNGFALDGCEIQYFVDGVPWRGGVPDLAVESIESIEVYNGASQLPPQYHGPDAMCGVVAIWTRH